MVPVYHDSVTQQDTNEEKDFTSPELRNAQGNAGRSFVGATGEKQVWKASAG